MILERVPRTNVYDHFFFFFHSISLLLLLCPLLRGKFMAFSFSLFLSHSFLTDPKIFLIKFNNKITLIAQARREREEQEKMKQDSQKSSQHLQQHHKSQQQQQDHGSIVTSQNSHSLGGHGGHGGVHLGNHGVGGLVSSHLHHPSLVQNDLKLGLGGMGMGGGLAGNLSMMGQLDNKNQDILKAVSKVSS
jgi:hypothetical protein